MGGEIPRKRKWHRQSQRSKRDCEAYWEMQDGTLWLDDCRAKVTKHPTSRWETHSLEFKRGWLHGQPDQSEYAISSAPGIGAGRPCDPRRANQIHSMKSRLGLGGRESSGSWLKRSSGRDQCPGCSGGELPGSSLTSSLTNCETLGELIRLSPPWNEINKPYLHRNRTVKWENRHRTGRAVPSAHRKPVWEWNQQRKKQAESIN